MGIFQVKNFVLRSTLSVLLCSFFIALGVGAVHAATPPSTVNNTNTLKVAPVRTDISIPAGTTGKVSTFVTNLTKDAIVLHPIENDFIAGDEKGTPAIILDENSYAPTHSLKRFMVPLKDFTVAPGETKQVDVTITVPKNAQAGGYFGALRFAPASTTGGNTVNLSASVASLILMTVPGPTEEKLKLTNFDVQQDGSGGSNFRTPDNLKLLLRFENEGNIQLAPLGQIYVKKGDKVVYTYDFNKDDPKEMVLPDSARRWEVPLEGMGKFGKYTVGATLTYGTKNQTIEISKTIWIIPTMYIVGAIVGLLVLILVVVLIWMFLRSYKRRILRSSNRRYRR